MPSGSVSRHSVSVLVVVHTDVGAGDGCVAGGVVTGSAVAAGDVVTVGCARVSISRERKCNKANLFCLNRLGNRQPLTTIQTHHVL